MVVFRPLACGMPLLLFFLAGVFPDVLGSLDGSRCVMPRLLVHVPVRNVLGLVHLPCLGWHPLWDWWWWSLWSWCGVEVFCTSMPAPRALLVDEELPGVTPGGCCLFGMLAEVFSGVGFAEPRIAFDFLQLVLRLLDVFFRCLDEGFVRHRPSLYFFSDQSSAGQLFQIGLGGDVVCHELVVDWGHALLVVLLPRLVLFLALE